MILLTMEESVGKERQNKTGLFEKKSYCFHDKHSY